jgi:hypothetical protein
VESLGLYREDGGEGEGEGVRCVEGCACGFWKVKPTGAVHGSRLAGGDGASLV